MPLLGWSALPWSISPCSVMLVKTVCLLRRDLNDLPFCGVVSSSELTTVFWRGESWLSNRCALIISAAAVGPVFGVRTGVSHMTNCEFRGPGITAL